MRSEPRPFAPILISNRVQIGGGGRESDPFDCRSPVPVPQCIAGAWRAASRRRALSPLGARGGARIAAVQGHDLRDQVSNITLPTLVIAAADDQITPVGFSDELACLIPGAEKVILPHGGHFVPRVSTAAYNAAVVSFLTQPATEA